MNRRDVIKLIAALGLSPSILIEDAVGSRSIPALERIRYSSTTERTRIVFDISGKVYKKNVSSVLSDGSIYITINGLRVDKVFKKLPGNLASYVAVVRRGVNKAKIKIKLKAPHKYKIFALNPCGSKPFRIVVDVFPDFVTTHCKRRRHKTRVVVIDPGHGGRDPGAVYPPYSRYPLIMEKNITLPIALKVKKFLKDDKGIKVIMTRERDVYVPLIKRAEIAAKSCADAFVSIHADSMPNYPEWNGVTVFKASPRLFAKAQTVAKKLAKRVKLCSDTMCWSVSPLLINMANTVTFVESGRLARFIVKNLKASTDEEIINGIRDMRRNITVLKIPGRPAVLIESGFMTNREDRHKLIQDWYQEEIAYGIAKGIREYISYINEAMLV